MPRIVDRWDTCAVVWADADTEDNCRAELREVLEGWVLLHISDHTAVPPVDGVTVQAGSLV